jgi:hypothetical protein
MDSKQLKDLLTQIEELKTPGTPLEFQAGVDAAREVISQVMQEAVDRERMQSLEAELAQLRARYPENANTTQKKRGRKPKQITPEDTEFEKVAGA